MWQHGRVRALAGGWWWWRRGPGLSTGVERWEVVVVMRRPGPYALKREGGGRRGDMAGSRQWCGKVGGGGDDEVAGSLRARAGGWWMSR